MPERMFSIITVTLNSGKALEKTVASVSAQDFSDYEHLIKDGGSEDSSVLAIFLNPKARLITSPDQGIYDAMNQALEACQGRFVIFLNAGDVLADRMVLRKIADRLREKETDLLYGCVVQDGVRLNYPEILSEWYMVRNSICHQAWVLRRSSCLAVGGFNLDYRVLADHYMLLDLICNHQISYQFFKDSIVSLAPMGFSAVNWRLKREERNRMVAFFFGGLRGRLLRLMHAATFPGARIWLSKKRYSRKIYCKISNLFNQ